MTLKEFIRRNRAELDARINGARSFVPKEASCRCPKSGTDHRCHDGHRLNDSDREEWINNDPGLYRWARSQGWPG